MHKCDLKAAVEVYEYRSCTWIVYVRNENVMGHLPFCFTVCISILGFGQGGVWLLESMLVILNFENGWALCLEFDIYILLRCCWFRCGCHCGYLAECPALHKKNCHDYYCKNPLKASVQAFPYPFLCKYSQEFLHVRIIQVRRLDMKKVKLFQKHSVWLIVNINDKLPTQYIGIGRNGNSYIYTYPLHVCCCYQWLSCMEFIVIYTSREYF